MAGDNHDPTEIPGQVDLEPGSPEPVVNADPSARIARLARGTRPLGDAERTRRQQALTCAIVEPDEAGSSCTQVLHLSVFFDGTGNNREEEMRKPEDRRALSNIARLHDAHVDRTESIERIYLAGVGTPCPEVGDKGGTRGLAIGSGGAERVAYALEQLDGLIDKQPEQMRILVVNVSVFGFSRGAAQARAFVRDLAARCERQSDGSFRYRQVPLRVGFLGIFDTVCSVWRWMAGAMVNQNNGHNLWAHDVKLPALVEQCVHMTAAHELRPQFPLDSTRDDARYPSNTIEIWYPGVHSDVGGGYDAAHQGRKNGIARFALNELYDMAREGGVLLRDLDDLLPEIRAEFDKSEEDLRAAYNGYLQAVRQKRGRMEDVQAAHMELLHRWLKIRVDAGGNTGSTQRLREREAALDDELRTLSRAQRHLPDPYAEPMIQRPTPAEQAEWNRLDALIRERRDRRAEVRKQRRGLDRETATLARRMDSLRRKRTRGRRLTMSEQVMLAAWENPEPLPAAVEEFFDGYGHDSISHWFTGDLTVWRTIHFGRQKYTPGTVDVVDTESTATPEPALN
ncbi:hypothetical protein CO641_08430 [Lysobacteraceae bacterium NML91-0213]|nr:hypothetical protein CO641_08430 [Xanthomonadaceae bacterium NML91-0213]